MAVTRELEPLCSPTHTHASLKRRSMMDPLSRDASAPRPAPQGESVPRSSTPGPKRKLPRMNPSERAKYYRRRVREYMERLEETDSGLARNVENLELVHSIQQRLIDLHVTHSRRHVLAHIWAFMDTKQYLHHHQSLETPQFQLHGVDVLGDAAGVIVRLDAIVTGSFSTDTVEKQLYPFVPGNARLLDKLLRATLRFTSSYRFFFDGDGELVQQTSETDFAAGLVASLACSSAEARQLLQALGEVDAVHRSADGTRPRPTIAFLDEN